MEADLQQAARRNICFCYLVFDGILHSSYSFFYRVITCILPCLAVRMHTYTFRTITATVVVCVGSWCVWKREITTVSASYGKTTH
jgi:hypothetical protein